MLNKINQITYPTGIAKIVYNILTLVYERYQMNKKKKKKKKQQINRIVKAPQFMSF